VTTNLEILHTHCTYYCLGLCILASSRLGDPSHTSPFTPKALVILLHLVELDRVTHLGFPSRVATVARPRTMNHYHMVPELFKWLNSTGVQADRA
jgi:hypothetical protein